MMDAVKKVNYVIELTEEEAAWLKGVLQNPIIAADVLSELLTDKETPEMQKRRSVMWAALDHAGV